jgi:hypothetical protein
MMFHYGLEEHIARYSGALRYLPSRLDIERTVFTDFLAANVNYRQVAEP